MNYQRYKGDIIQTLKIFHEIKDLDFELFFSKNKSATTRNWEEKLYVNFE